MDFARRLKLSIFVFVGGHAVADPNLDVAALEAADADLLDFVLEEANKRLSAQVQLMLAADSRAAGIRTGCITLSAAGLGIAMTQLRDGHLDALFYAAAAFTAVEAVAAIVALTALWPEPVKPPGWSPASFAEDLAKSAKRVQSEVAMHLQSRIEDNRACARKLGRRVQGAMVLSTLGPLLGLAVGLAAEWWA